MPSRARLRRLAACVLLVWLFGLASGIVNACVLGSESRHAVHDHLVAVHVHDADGSMDGPDQPGAHEHHGAQGKPPCQPLCDAPAAARSADNELASVLAGFWLAPAPLPSIAVRATEAPAAPAPRATQAWRPGVPLPIAFLRLTL